MSEIDIRVTRISSKLRRIPVGFYAVVKSEDGTHRTLNKPAAVGQDIVEWDDQIVLPSGSSPRISLTVLASFELGRPLGAGEILREIHFTVDELLDRSKGSEVIKLLEEDDGDIQIKIERIASPSGYAIPSMPLVSDKGCRIEDLVERGRRALISYRELQEQQGLDDSITYFERARDLCLPDHCSRATVLLSLANTKMLDCRMKGAFSNLDVPIELYRTALSLYSCDHPDYPLTLLSLGVGLKARFQRQADESDKAEADVHLSRVLDISKPDSYVYLTANLALNGAPNTNLLSQKDHAIEHNDNEEEVKEKLDRLDAILQWIFYYPHALRPPPLDQLGILFCVRLDWMRHLINRKRAISVLDLAVQYTSDDHPDKPAWLTDLAHLLWDRYERFGDVMDLAKSVSLEVGLTPDEKPLRLGNLAVSLSSRYERFGNIEDLEKSISLEENAVQLTPDGHQRLHNLASSLSSRYDHLGNIMDLEKSMSLEESAMQLTPDDHPEKPRQLHDFAYSLLNRYERFGDVVDLDRSILLKEDVLRRTPDGHSDKPIMLGSLAVSLTSRYDRSGDIVDLEKSISLEQGAIQLTADDHPDKPQRLHNLASSLMRRYRCLGEISDLEMSITLEEDALRLTPDDHPDKSFEVVNLAQSLSNCYRRFGDIMDLEKAILLEDTLQLTQNGHLDKTRRLQNLASSLARRYNRFGNIVDLEKSVLLKEETLQLTPDGHPDRPAVLSNLAHSLLSRYERFGDIADLERSISLREDALQLTQDDHPDNPTRLRDLAHALSSRYDRFGDIVDLEKSVSLQERVLQLTPDSRPSKLLRLRDLASLLSSRHQRLGDIMDLEKSISLMEDALRLVPDDHPDKLGVLYNLAYSLWCRHERFGDLEKSISLDEHIVQRPSRQAYSLCEPCVHITSRYDRFGDIVDLEKSISLKEDALRLTPDDHAEKSGRLGNLAVLSSRYERFGHVTDRKGLFPWRRVQWNSHRMAIRASLDDSTILQLHCPIDTNALEIL